MNELANNFFTDLRGEKYNFLQQDNEPEQNRRLYNLFVTVMNNLDKNELKIYTTSSTEELIKKYKLQGIKIEIVMEPEFNAQRQVTIDTKKFTENLTKFFNY